MSDHITGKRRVVTQQDATIMIFGPVHAAFLLNKFLWWTNMFYHWRWVWPKVKKMGIVKGVLDDPYDGILVTWFTLCGIGYAAYV